MARIRAELWAIALTLFSTMVGAFSPIILKKEAAKVVFKLKSWLNWRLICGLALGGFSVIIFIPALSAGDLSLLYPLTSLTYVWVSILSVRFLKEKMNWPKWLGIFSIVLGAALISIGSG